MGSHSLRLLDDLDISPGQSVVELACGTGHLTREIASAARDAASLHVVDKSRGMIEVAKAKVAARHPTLDLTFTEDDMEDSCGTRPTGSADHVVIGWAICYAKPVRLLREAARVLRPGARSAVIETRADTLTTLRTPSRRSWPPTRGCSPLSCGSPCPRTRTSCTVVHQGRAEPETSATARRHCRAGPPRRHGVGGAIRSRGRLPRLLRPDREDEIRARLYDALERHRREHGSAGA